MNKPTQWFQVTREQFDRMQVGKKFRMDGRVVKVVERSEDSGKMSTGWSHTACMVRVKEV
jgi:hypothetical protein